MILKAYSVYDKKVEAFMPPFWARSHGEATRSFVDACTNPQHQFSKNAADFDLFHCFDFEDQSGLVASDRNSVTQIYTGLEAARSGE